MSIAFHVTMQAPFEEMTIHSSRESFIRKVIGEDLIELRSIKFRPYKPGEAHYNNHCNLDSSIEHEQRKIFLRAQVMRGALRKPGCAFCEEHAGAMKLKEHKRLPRQFWSGNTAPAYKLTLQSPFQEMTVRSHYEGSVEGMIPEDVKRLRSVEIRPYELNEPQTKRFCALNNSTSEQHSLAVYGLHLFVMEGSMRAPGCTSCQVQA